MPGLLDQLKEFFTPELVGKIASQLGESPEAAGKAIQASVPSMLVGLLDTASRSGGADKVVDAMKGQNWDKILKDINGQLGSGTLPDPASSPSAGGLGGLLGMGQSILKLIFGSNLGKIIAMVAGMAAFKGGGMGKLLMLLAPLLLGNLGKVLGGMPGGLNASNLTDLLKSNKDDILKAAPAGLSSALGLASLGDIGKSAAAAVSSAAGTAASKAEGGLPGWLLPVLGLAALALIAYALLGNPAGPEGEVKEVAPGGGAAAPAVDDATKAVTEAAGALKALELPTGNLELPEGSPLFAIADALKTLEPGAPPKAFGLTGLDFEGATANLPPAATSMIEKLAAILKAFTDIKARIVGHTAKTDSADADQKLGLDRVTAIKDLLVKAGLAGDTIEVESAGSTGDNPANLIEILLSK
jgi:outer membrane protein OmpA-like peptidoglycan-associated protein